MLTFRKLQDSPHGAAVIRPVMHLINSSPCRQVAVSLFQTCSFSWIEPSSAGDFKNKGVFLVFITFKIITAAMRMFKTGSGGASTAFVH